MMKIIITAILAIIGAAMVAADDFPSNMPECGKTCGRNMLSQSAQLGCHNNDVPCLCRNANFGYGIHDCSVQACGNVDEANIAIGWGNKLCADAGVPANIPSASAVGASSGGGASTSVGSGSSSSSGASSAPQATVTSPIISTRTSGSSTFETTVGSTTLVSSQAAHSTSSSSAEGAQMTAAPALGVLAAAGIAAALL